MTFPRQLKWKQMFLSFPGSKGELIACWAAGFGACGTHMGNITQLLHDQTWRISPLIRGLSNDHWYLISIPDALTSVGKSLSVEQESQCRRRWWFLQGLTGAAVGH